MWTRRGAATPACRVGTRADSCVEKEKPGPEARAIMQLLLLSLTLPAIATAEPRFEFRNVSPTSLGLYENGKPVYVYNHGVMKPKGVPEDRHRCCYVHPVWAPNGVIVTDDFPADHYHHRGIFWVWPIVQINGQQHDLWAIDTIRKRFIRWVDRKVTANTAKLTFENGWFVGDEEVVRERIEIVAHPGHRLDFTLRFEALKKRIGLQGDPTNQKGYGGFCVRFAPRKETVITTDAGRETKDSNMVPHPWAREDGLFEGGRAGLRIDIDPSNPGHPNGWCLRHYGFLGVNYPGNEMITLRPGQPLEMKYTVTTFGAN